jgi:hypothetical protein
MGIRFDGHPNLKRILTHEAFQGHALRKDYDPGQRWVLTEEETWSRTGRGPAEDDEHFETQVLNLGPSHPATHGTLRTVIRLDGEVITRAETEIGYLHRCFEKMSETHGWNEVIPYTDRLNYCSAMMNGVGYALAVERCSASRRRRGPRRSGSSCPSCPGSWTTPCASARTSTTSARSPTSGTSSSRARRSTRCSRRAPADG